MTVDGEKRHCTTIKGISRLLSKLNRKTRRPYHFCMNCLNGFRTESARDKHYEYCSSNGHVKVNMPTKKERWLKFHDDQYQFKVAFMLYADLIESILTLIWVGFLGVRFEVRGGSVGDKFTPCLKLARIKLETSNLARKYTPIFTFRNIPFSA